MPQWLLLTVVAEPKPMLLPEERLSIERIDEHFVTALALLWLLWTGSMLPRISHEQFCLKLRRSIGSLVQRDPPGCPPKPAALETLWFWLPAIATPYDPTAFLRSHPIAWSNSVSQIEL